ncbi:MAG: DUF393 domain-containing protein [Gemmatimonadetes bacterium]|nr:DUF393 domain-containing protein [Gemmatimonadota bacterium]
MTAEPGIDRPILIYDGSCGFCRRWVSRLKRWDRADRIRLLTLQDDAAPHVSARARTELELAAHVVLPSGEVLAGAAAFHALCRYLPGGWLPRGILSLPGALAMAERTYRWIARRWGPVGDREHGG